MKLEGSMSLDKRNKTIAAFNTDPTVTCFLMSLKAGGVALNLTVASHVMLMDPWCAPSRCRTAFTPTRRHHACAQRTWASCTLGGCNWPGIWRGRAAVAAGGTPRWSSRRRTASTG